MVDSTYQTKVYTKQGGDELVVANGGTATVESGGVLNVEEGGGLRRSGAVPAAAGSAQGDATALTAQRNAVTGADGTKGVKLPTAVAGDTVLVINTSSTAILKVYPATGAAINGLSANAAFSLGPGRSAQFEATSATQWYCAPLAVCTPTVNETNESANVLSSASTITLGAPSGTTQTATIQAKDSDGNNIAAVQRLEVYMCTDSAGATPSGTGVNTSVTATTGTVLKAHTAKLHLEVITDANGVAVLSFNNASGGGSYTDRVALVLPNGKLVVSNALAVANA